MNLSELGPRSIRDFSDWSFLPGVSQLQWSQPSLLLLPTCSCHLWHFFSPRACSFPSQNVSGGLDGSSQEHPASSENSVAAHLFYLDFPSVNPHEMVQSCSAGSLIFWYTAWNISQYIHLHAILSSTQAAVWNGNIFLLLCTFTCAQCTCHGISISFLLPPYRFWDLSFGKFCWTCPMSWVKVSILL